MEFVLSLDLVAYMQTLSPREKWKLCRTILMKLDARKMTAH